MRELAKEYCAENTEMIFLTGGDVWALARTNFRATHNTLRGDTKMSPFTGGGVHSVRRKSSNGEGDDPSTSNGLHCRDATGTGLRFSVIMFYSEPSAADSRR